MSILDDLITEHGVLLLDGAMGTELFSRGLPAGHCPELWNVEEPDRVKAVHEAYLEAGSDVVLSNSFGGTTYRLKLHQLETRVIELNRAAAQIARSAVDAVDRKALVAGSMGPTGELLVPLGEMTHADAVAAFAEQATGLTDGGADILWIETMSDLGEIEAAVEGARSASPLPVVVTLSFDTAGRSMMGVTGANAVTRLAELGVAAVGANCGDNLFDTEAALAEMIAANTGVHIVAKANAGMPEWVGSELHYSGSPEVMAAYAHRMRNAGVALVGACCGSAPDHVAHMRKLLDGTIDVPDVAAPEAPARLTGDAAPRARTGRRRPKS